MTIAWVVDSERRPAVQQGGELISRGHYQKTFRVDWSCKGDSG
jgi:hypothetical protein